MRIAHFGTFDVENFGDLLFPLIAADRLSSTEADISFVSPVGGPPIWDDCVATVPPATLDGEQIDAVLLGGGNIIHAGKAGVDAYRSDGLATLLTYSRLWLAPSEIAVAQGLPLCWNAPGVPEPVSPRAAAALQWAADAADYLSVRDQHSLRNLQHAGVEGRAVVVPDTALDVPAIWSDEVLAGAREALFRARDRPVPERTIVLHLNDRYITGPAESLATRLDGVARHANATPVLLALGPCHGDGGVARSVAAKMTTEPVVLDQPGSLREIVATIQAAEAYVGSSLHGLITALAFGRRGMVVAYESDAGGKFSGFLEQFQLTEWLVPSWAEAETRVRELLAAPIAPFARVASTAAPTLDQHWKQIAESLTSANPRSGRTRPKTTPSLRGVVQEGIDELIGVIEREREHATRQSACLDDAEQRLQAAAELQEASETERERLTTEVEALRSDFPQIKARLEDAQVDVARLSSEAEASRDRAEALAQEHGLRVEEHRRELEAERAASAERATELETQFAASVRRHDELQALLSARGEHEEQRLAAAAAEVQRGVADVRALTAVLAQREQTLQGAIEGQVDAVRTVTRLEGELTSARAQLEDASIDRVKLDGAQARVEDIVVELSVARRRTDERDTIIARLGEALEHARGEQRTVRERLRAAEEEAVDAGQTYEQLQEELEELTQEVLELHADTERKAAVHAASGAEKDRLQAASQQATDDLQLETTARTAAEALLTESLDRERSVRQRAFEERDGLEERLEATLAALNEARRPVEGEAALQGAATDQDRVRAELLVERAAREALEGHVAALRAEIDKRGSRRPNAGAAGGAASAQRITAPLAGSMVGPSDAAHGPDAVTRSAFADRYAGLWGPSGIARLSERDRALPWPVFRPAEGPAGASPRVSVIVCVHDAIDHVRPCLESVARHLSVDAEVVLVNDGSDAPTTVFLEAVADSDPRVYLATNEDPPHGYTVAANIGLRAASGDYLILLNSDTVVTRGWLERIVACGDAHPNVGIIGPVSNAASHQSVPLVREDGAWATNPLPGWLTADGMATAVASVSLGERPQVPFLNGFCLAIKREVLEAIGYLDEERFGEGYCEENDFSLRALKNGFTSVIADDAFVYHAKSRSYTQEGRAQRAARNYKKFIDKHGVKTVQPLVDQLDRRPPLATLGKRLEDVLRDPGSFASGIHERLGDRVRPLFVLPGVAPGGSGGSHSIVQEARVMNGFGVPARIAVPAAAADGIPETYPDDAALFLSFRHEKDLRGLLAETNVLVATHSDSVALVAALAEGRDDVLTAYYVQDYEPLFWPPGSDNAAAAAASYTRIPGQLLFAKTRWVCNIVSAAHRVPVSRVEPSIDRSLYRPSEAPRPPAPVVVTAMVRPRTPRRQAGSTVRLLARLAAAFGDEIEIVTFGCPQQDLNDLTGDPRLRAAHLGPLSRSAVGDLLRRAHVFLDHSIYQAFGRTALEAMACGCVPVMPATGGAWQFASPDVNAVMCDTSDDVATYAAVRALVENHEGRAAMAREAIATAANFSVECSAVSIFALFADALLARGRVGRHEHLAVRAG